MTTPHSYEDAIDNAPEARGMVPVRSVTSPDYYTEHMPEADLLPGEEVVWEDPQAGPLHIEPDPDERGVDWTYGYWDREWREWREPW